jgi:hypothetical protein
MPGYCLSGGVRINSIQSIIDDLNLQRKINKNLGKAVGHIALSWSEHDREKLTPDIMVEKAQEYMQLMGIKIHNTSLYNIMISLILISTSSTIVLVTTEKP